MAELDAQVVREFLAGKSSWDLRSIASMAEDAIAEAARNEEETKFSENIPREIWRMHGLIRDLTDRVTALEKEDRGPVDLRLTHLGGVLLGTGREFSVSMIPLAERVLLELIWMDCTNVAGGWHDGEDLETFATNQAWETTNTGWLVWEDVNCYVLASRMTTDGLYVGLIERIPKAAVTGKKLLLSPRSVGCSSSMSSRVP